jgi:hypothetical protein
MQEGANVVAEHYQKTYELTLQMWEQRNTTLLYLIAVVGAAALLTSWLRFWASAFSRISRGAITRLLWSISPWLSRPFSFSLRTVASHDIKSEPLSGANSLTPANKTTHRRALAAPRASSFAGLQVEPQPHRTLEGITQNVIFEMYNLVNWGRVMILPLSDKAWQRVSHLLEQNSRQRIGRPARNPRDVLNAILWVITRGEKWHRLPAHYPPSQTCYIKWLQWRRAGLMSRVLDELGIGDCPAADQ